jgi:hypothetical protein
MEPEENPNEGGEITPPENPTPDNGEQGGEEMPPAHNPFGDLPEPPEPPKPSNDVDDLDDDDKAAFQKMIDANNASRDEEIRNIRVNSELNNIFNGKHGEVYKQYEEPIRKALNDPRAKGMPVSSVVKSVVPTEAFIRFGAQAARESDKKARQSGGGGGRSGAGSKPSTTAFEGAKSPQDRQAIADQIRRGEVKIFDTPQEG